MELSPQEASRSGEAKPALPGRPVQREIRRQAAARMWRCMSDVNASRGVRQFRHLSGRPLSMRSIRLISSSRMASNGLPLGRILRTTPLRFSFVPRSHLHRDHPRHLLRSGEILLRVPLPYAHAAQEGCQLVVASFRVW